MKNRVGQHSSSSCAVIAHRGFSGVAPENTMASFQKAMSLNVDGIELDVHQTKDGKIVVIHDDKINRTTNGKGCIGDLNYEELLAFDAGSWFSPAFKTQKIPLLEEVLKLVNGQAMVYVEIKKGKDYYAGIEQKILDIIKQCDARTWCVLHSFEKPTLQRIHALDDTIPMMSTMYVPPWMGSLFLEKIFFRGSISSFRNLMGININQEALHTSLVNKLHQRGLRVITWTVNEYSDIARMRKMGVDGIISNYPDRVIGP